MMYFGYWLFVVVWIMVSMRFKRPFCTFQIHSSVRFMRMVFGSLAWRKKLSSEAV